MLLKLYEKNNNPQDLQQVVDILNDGGLIIYPTDTMYAIGCHGLKERAIERICRIKEIDPRKNNLSIICYDETQPARCFHFHPERHYPPAKDFP